MTDRVYLYRVFSDKDPESFFSYNLINKVYIVSPDLLSTEEAVNIAVEKYGKYNFVCDEEDLQAEIVPFKPNSPQCFAVEYYSE